MDMLEFDPSAMALEDSGIFGLPFQREESRLVLLPVPWETTTSYGDGTSLGPESIRNASRQVDLFDIETGDVYRHGIFMEPISDKMAALGKEMKAQAQKRLMYLETSSEATLAAAIAKKVNAASERLNSFVYGEAKKIIAEGRTLGVLGGDHSSPFGAIQALSEHYAADFGILHVDAHADLRVAYQDYTHSHASIMYNVMSSSFAPRKLVQVGIRDFSEDEFKYIKKNSSRIHTYFDPLLKRRGNRGETWQSLCEEMIQHLPKRVYVSFDIDGLSPDLCPSTGTPVPGGLSFDQALTLLACLVESGRQIIGFDLCEVAQPADAENEWDANVGARILFKLCGWTLLSSGLKPSAAFSS